VPVVTHALGVVPELALDLQFWHVAFRRIVIAVSQDRALVGLSISVSLNEGGASK